MASESRMGLLLRRRAPAQERRQVHSAEPSPKLTDRLVWRKSSSVRPEIGVFNRIRPRCWRALQIVGEFAVAANGGSSCDAVILAQERSSRLALLGRQMGAVDVIAVNRPTRPSTLKTAAVAPTPPLDAVTEVIASLSRTLQARCQNMAEEGKRRCKFHGGMYHGI